MVDQQEGRLEVGATRASGKEVTEWQFKSPFTDRKLPDLSVKVSIHNDRKGLRFRAHGPCLPEAIEDSDIERLRQQVETALREQHARLTASSWHDWLEIEVHGREDTNRRETERESTLSIKYRRLKRYDDPETGQAFVLNNNGYASSFPKPKKAGFDDEGKPAGDWDLGSRSVHAEYSYLPATPENIAALEDLMARLNALRTTLSTFLSQDNAQAALLNVAGLLPAPAATRE